MNNKLFYPKKVFVVKECFGFAKTESILNNLNSIPIEIINDEQEAIEEIDGYKDRISEGKKNLLLSINKGEVVKPCPCTPGHVRCGYYNINTDLQCPLDCSYCILQVYLTNPIITSYVNTEEIEGQINLFLKNNRRPLRIGTGELGDSLALDHITSRSGDMIKLFRNNPHASFELKTKTVNIENVLNIDPADNIVVSWSLNVEKMAFLEEKNAPTTARRIQAAQLIAERGYKTAFHFDPIIRYPGWESGYHEVIAKLMSRINRKSIAWISLGALRFNPDLKPVIQKRFPDSKIIYEELIKGKDGKFRYFKPLRIELFKKIIKYFKKEGGSGLPFYLCMESKAMWDSILDKKKGKEDIEKYLSLPLK